MGKLKFGQWCTLHLPMTTGSSMAEKLSHISSVSKSWCKTQHAFYLRSEPTTGRELFCSEWILHLLYCWRAFECHLCGYISALWRKCIDQIQVITAVSDSNHQRCEVKGCLYLSGIQVENSPTSIIDCTHENSPTSSIDCTHCGSIPVHFAEDS